MGRWFIEVNEKKKLSDFTICYRLPVLMGVAVAVPTLNLRLEPDTH
jgi:hypothetical protein